MLLFASLVAFAFAATLVMAHSLWHAPVGVEDSAGFHQDGR
ncbi:MAG TPA: hypothetical protein VHD32_16925 [Candidatus Didemnitutus sp.]|nr:hypothetical protein [Candidatus Didemnitutus sp.]